MDLALNKKIIELCTASNLLISPDTLQYIKKNEKPFEFMQQTLDEITKLETKPLVLTIEVLMKIIQQKSLMRESLIVSSSEEAFPTISSQEEVKSPISDSFKEVIEKNTSSNLSKDVSEYASAAKIKDDIVILKDATGLMSGEGKIEDIRDYFHDRFNKLRKLLLKRPDCKSAMTIEQVKGLKSSQEAIKVIGMVLEKKALSAKSSLKIRDVTTNSVSVEIDDLESTLTVIFSGKNEALIKKVSKIKYDEVICIEGFITEEKVFIASDLSWPDVPHQSEIKHEVPPLCAVFLSDTHFGSKFFSAPRFEAFLEFLHGKTGDEARRALAKSIKYVIIAGDLIDGIGVYPNQEQNLAIPTITEQYDLAAQYLKRIPLYIKIIIIPGGPHDAVRKAYPQPALSNKYASALYRLKNVILLGNPAQFKLHGVNILVFHGDSIDDLIRVIPGSSYQKSTEIMKELIICRHLTPVYGASTWIAPEKEDWMVIEDTPEIFHCGHSHIPDFKKYRGIILINSGTFQEETEYQRSLGIKPIPGKVPIINLRTLKGNFLNF